MSIAYVLMGVAIIIPLCKKLSIVSSLLIIGNGVLSIGQLYFLPYRAYHQLLAVLFAFSILNLVGWLLYFFMVRKQHDTGVETRLLNGVIPFAYICGSIFVKGFALFKLIETDYDMPLAFVAISLGITVVATILGAIFIEDRRDRKEYAGKLCAIFFGMFFLVFMVPLLSMEYANYTFDTSVAEKQECVVIDKETSHNYKSGTGYRLIIQAGDQKLRFDVEKVLYFQYEKGDTICLYAYDGAFDNPYYEYRLDAIYRYKE
jgi:hypothetical protein